MQVEFNNILTISLVLFAIIDILGTIPMLLDIRNKIGDIDAKFATIVSGGIMILFLFGGKYILKIINIKKMVE